MGRRLHDFLRKLQLGRRLHDFLRKVQIGLSLKRNLTVDEIKSTRKNPFATVFPMNFVDYSIIKDNRFRTEVWFNLVHIAFADGFLHPAELAFLVRFASECGISVASAKEIVDHPEDIDYVPPMNQQEKKLLLEEMIRMGMADGDLGVREIEMIKKRTLALDLDKTYLQTLLEMYNQYKMTA